MIQQNNKVRRKGMILLVVVAFLALFSVMGVTYLIYADSQLRQSVDGLSGQDARQDSMRMVDLNPSFMLNFFLEKFLYDEADATRNPITGGVLNSTPPSVYSAIRGHSLARNIYGWNDTPYALNDRPFGGTGKSLNPVMVGGANTPLSNIVNYTFFAPSVTDNAPVKLDPQRGIRAVLANPSQITEPWNSSVTMVDNNNFYLGALSADASSITPSFHRQSIFGPTDRNSYSPGPGFNNNWVSAQGKYLSARPRPVDQLNAADQTSAGANLGNLYSLTVQRASAGALFPYPEADGFDVKNLEGFPTGNDSVWLDVGSPVFKAPDGRTYKILIAPLILDLDGRINLNVAGNLMKRTSDPMSMPPILPQYNADHASNQGWGRWEINPKLISQDVPAANPPAVANNEFLNILSFKTISDLAASTQNSDQWSNLKFPGRYRNGVFLPPGGNSPPQEYINKAIPHSYAMVDFNAAGNDGFWGDSIKPNYAAGGFPVFDQSFGNASASETSMASQGNYSYHAKFHNPFGIYKDPNGVYTYNFPASESAALLRWIGKGDSYSSSSLAKSMPATFGFNSPKDFSNPAVKARNRVTTVSSDLDRPAIVPIQPDSTSPYSNNFMFSNYLYPEKVSKNGMMAPYKYAPMADQVATVNQTSPALKMNLSRPLTSYPNLKNNMSDQTNYVDYVADKNQFDQATKERQSLAREIFDNLRNVTGVIKYEQALADSGNMAIPMADRNAINGNLIEIKKTNRWFAQLAVNIVDYMDNDDFMTAFNWTSDPKDWVFGIELPRITINEVFTMAQNDSGDTFNNNQNATMDTQFFTAVELMNSLPQDPNYGNGPGGHNAVMQFKDATGTTYANYRVVLCQPGQVYNQLNALNGQYFNDIGSHDFNGTNIAMDANGMGKAVLDDWTDAGYMPPNPVIAPPPTWVLPANNGSPLVVSDDTTLRTEADPKINVNLKSSKLKLKSLNKAQNPSNTNAPEVMLQRLVYPGMPHNEFDAMTGMLSNGALPYNPYITVDVFSKRKMWDLRKFDSTAAKMPDVTTTSSHGRKYPFLDSTGIDQATPSNSVFNGNNSTVQVGGNGGAQHTMGQPNSNITNPVPWLTHLDRQLINPMELIHVATVKPHELTQTANRWMDQIGQNFDANPPQVPARNISPYASNWPWFDENTRLHRFLELAGVAPLQSGESVNGRVLGKVNVNTMPDNVVFQAVADAAPANNFNSADVNNAYTNVMSLRPISSLGQTNNADFSGPKSKTGVNKSLLGYSAFDSSNPGNVEQPSINPLDVQVFSGTGNSPAIYARKEILTKIANSVTTRSNVFGIWLTTGYFEVDATTTPPRLLAEIGKSEGANIRHRMFAIVDRTNMVSFSTSLSDLGLQDTSTGMAVNLPTTNVPNVGVCPNISAGMTVVNWNRSGQSQTGRPWKFTQGMLLTFDPNTTNEETVELQDVGGGVLGAKFQKNHAGNSIIINRGNPGPWAGYDRTKDKDVVIYSEIIE